MRPAGWTWRGRRPGAGVWGGAADPRYGACERGVAWAARAGVDVPALTEQYGGRIELLHIKDATNLGGDRPTFTNLGEGEVPLQEILAAAEEHADIAYYVMEYDMAPQGEDFVATGFEYLTGQEAGEPQPADPKIGRASGRESA